MKRFTVVSMIVAAAMLTGCLGRPNPRVSKIVKQSANDDDAAEVLAFSYDDDGRIDEVVKTEGDDVRTWNLSWSDGLLTKVVVVESDDGDARSEVTHDLAYESGRLASVHAESDDGASDGVFSYDSGRFVQSEVTGANGVALVSVTYGDDGQIESIVKKDEDRQTSIAVERDEGVLSAFTIVGEGSEPTKLELAFDEDTKQLDEIVFVESQVRSVVAFSYDDEGRVESTEQTIDMGAIQGDVATTDVEYEDGDARSLDVSADQVFLFGFFFDMKGGHWGTFDNATTVPRLAFPSW